MLCPLKMSRWFALRRLAAPVKKTLLRDAAEKSPNIANLRTAKHTFSGGGKIETPV